LEEMPVFCHWRVHFQIVLYLLPMTLIKKTNGFSGLCQSSSAGFHGMEFADFVYYSASAAARLRIPNVPPHREAGLHDECRKKEVICAENPAGQTGTGHETGEARAERRHGASQ
jgi:hypothetical protein